MPPLKVFNHCVPRKVHTGICLHQNQGLIKHIYQNRWPRLDVGSQASHAGLQMCGTTPLPRTRSAPTPSAARDRVPQKKKINTKNSQPRSRKREARSGYGVGDSTPRAGAPVPRVWAKLTVAGRSHAAPRGDEAYPWPRLPPPWRAVAMAAGQRLAWDLRHDVALWARFCGWSSWWLTGSAVARRSAAWIYERVAGVHGGTQIEN